MKNSAILWLLFNPNAMIFISENNLDLYINLFRGRNDIYARYWEKRNKYYRKCTQPQIVLSVADNQLNFNL
jgi:hypothetical protein